MFIAVERANQFKLKMDFTALILDYFFMWYMIHVYGQYLVTGKERILW